MLLLRNCCVVKHLIGSSKWYRAGSRLSQEEYETQGEEYTSQAIAALRDSATEDWSVVKKVHYACMRVRGQIVCCEVWAGPAEGQAEHARVRQSTRPKCLACGPSVFEGCGP